MKSLKKMICIVFILILALSSCDKVEKNIDELKTQETVVDIPDTIQTIEIGEKISIDSTMEIELNAVLVSDGVVVKRNDYNYVKKIENQEEKFLGLTLNVKNLSTDKLKLGDIINVVLIYKNEYEYQDFFITGANKENDFDKDFLLTPLVDYMIHYLIRIPDEVVDNISDSHVYIKTKDETYTVISSPELVFTYESNVSNNLYLHLNSIDEITKEIVTATQKISFLPTVEDMEDALNDMILSFEKFIIKSSDLIAEINQIDTPIYYDTQHKLYMDYLIRMNNIINEAHNSLISDTDYDTKGTVLSDVGVQMQNETAILKEVIDNFIFYELYIKD